MTMIHWGYSSIEEAAKVILAINSNGHPNVESVVDYIKRIADSYALECESNNEVPTITGTGGWYVTLYPSTFEGYRYGAEVTLMPYVVAKHLGLRD